jgi:hypothetical protein
MGWSASPGRSIAVGRHSDHRPVRRAGPAGGPSGDRPRLAHRHIPALAARAYKLLIGYSSCIDTGSPSRASTSILQLTGLQAAYAGSSRPARGRQAGEVGVGSHRAAPRGPRVSRGQQLDPAAPAREVGVSEHYVRGTLTALRGGTPTSAQRITQLWRLWGSRAASGSPPPHCRRPEGRVRQVPRCAPPSATAAPIVRSRRWWPKTAAGRPG